MNYDERSGTAEEIKNNKGNFCKNKEEKNKKMIDSI